MHRVGLGDEEWFLAGGEHAVGAEVERPGATRGPVLVAGLAVRQSEGVLHRVVGVAGGDVESLGQRFVVRRGPAVGDAGGDELVRSGVPADDVGLPADEVGGLLGLELPPGMVVLGLQVAVRRPRSAQVDRRWDQYVSPHSLLSVSTSP